MPDPTRPDGPEKIADAASLFDTDEVRPYQAPVSPPRPRISEPEPARPDPVVGGYDLEMTPPEVLSQEYDAPSPPNLPPPVARSRSKPKLKADREESGDTSEFEAELAVVDPVWTRGAEWGPDLVRLAMTGGATLIAVWSRALDGLVASRPSSCW